MSLMIADLYHALKEAGATEERASKAAEEVARYDNELTDIKADIKLMKWMLGTVLIMCTSILFKIFS